MMIIPHTPPEPFTCTFSWHLKFIVTKIKLSLSALTSYLLAAFPSSSGRNTQSPLTPPLLSSRFPKQCNLRYHAHLFSYFYDLCHLSVQT